MIHTGSTDTRPDNFRNFTLSKPVILLIRDVFLKKKVAHDAIISPLSICQCLTLLIAANEQLWVPYLQATSIRLLTFTGNVATHTYVRTAATLQQQRVLLIQFSFSLIDFCLSISLLLTPDITAMAMQKRMQ